MGYSAPGAGSLQGTICTQPFRAIITCNTRVSAHSSLLYFLLFYRCVTPTVLSENRLPATDYPTHPQRKVGEASLQWQVLICGLNSPLNWAMLLLLTISCGNPRKNLPLRRVTFPHVTSSPFFLHISLDFELYIQTLHLKHSLWKYCKPRRCHSRFFYSFSFCRRHSYCRII